ncbi:hypothetical protein [Clostridium sp. JNZ J1-5]
MFYDTQIDILSSADINSIMKTVYGDFQTYYKTIAFEDGYNIEITKRVFCDRDNDITMQSYFLIGKKKYKVMDIKEWSDYLEVYLYECIK